MTEFDKIYVVWRKGVGSTRYAIGILEKKPDGKHVFNYLPKTVELQKKEGFTPYTEFQDLRKEYNGNVAEIFGQRLIKLDRPDINNFLKFWEVDLEKAQDKFYLLGKTQGLVATDNFEFLAEYNLQLDTHFLTELTGLSHNKLETGAIEKGDFLTFKTDPQNEYDKYAVKLFKGEKEVGHIKKYHSKIFYELNADKLKLEVKALEQQNGYIKRVFIKVSF
ncbi:MAG TPA: HIRAN domain-containing protein [Ferruginibacter sp.]|jgi:hypothetical protein|nr:HIRAN domain-containing protein [Ferruginibacter sp.]